jgi:hypothetical protein
MERLAQHERSDAMDPREQMRWEEDVSEREEERAEDVMPEDEDFEPGDDDTLGRPVQLQP